MPDYDAAPRNLHHEEDAEDLPEPAILGLPHGDPEVEHGKDVVRELGPTVLNASECAEHRSID